MRLPKFDRYYLMPLQMIPQRRAPHPRQTIVNEEKAPQDPMGEPVTQDKF